jgi:hypothetical protein
MMARDVEQILDELCLNARIPLDGLERPPMHGRLHRALAQHVRPAEHGVERRPELVRQGRQELVFQTVRFRGFLIKACVVDRNGGPARDAGGEQLVSLGEHARL